MVQSNEELLKGVAVEKFRSCIISDGESDCSSDEEAIVTIPLCRKVKKKQVFKLECTDNN